LLNKSHGHLLYKYATSGRIITNQIYSFSRHLWIFFSDLQTFRPPHPNRHRVLSRYNVFLYERSDDATTDFLSPASPFCCFSLSLFFFCDRYWILR